MAYTIRLADKADPADIQAIFDGADRFVEFADCPDVLPPPRSEALHQAIGLLLTFTGTDVLVAEEDDGRLLGGLGYHAARFTWNLSMVQCEEVFWWAYEFAPASVAMKLMREYRRRMLEEHGEHIAMFHKLTNSPDTVGKVYERLGARPVQTTYMGLAR